MSLFEHSDYRWRDTYFVLFDEANRPTTAALRKVLESLGDRFQISEIRSDAEGWFESLTLLSPIDYAGMDLSYNAGDDVLQQVEELAVELGRGSLTADEKEKLAQVKRCTARFEIFHFEQLANVYGEEEDEYLDPGGLLLVLQRLVDFSRGVAVDPQSGAFM